MSSKKLKLVFVLSLAFFAALTFSTACSFHQRNSHQLVKLSQQGAEKNHEINFLYSQQAYGGIYSQDPRLSEYVNSLGQKIVRQQNLPIHEFDFTIVNSSIPNIWSFPKGKVALTRGLLTELHNEAELMAILAHEIAHVSKNHGSINIQEVELNAGPVRLDVLSSTHHNKEFMLGALGSGSGLVTIKYDMQSEIEADKTSLLQISEMGYSSKGFSDFNERIYNYHKNNNTNWVGGFLAKHPTSEERVLATRNHISKQSTQGATESQNFSEKLKNLRQQSLAYQKLDDGYRALLNKEYPLAIQIADQALDLEPTEAHFYILKGKALAKLGYILDALNVFNRAIEINPKYFDAYLQRGLIKEQLDDFRQASNDLEISLSLLPTAEAYYALGEIDYQSNQEEAAIQKFRKASISDSPAGQQAISKLKELGLALYGIETIEVKPLFTKEGYINIEICNRGTKPLKNVVIDIDQIDAKGKLVYRHLVELSEDLVPQSPICKRTNIGPFFNEEHMNRCTQITPIYSE